MIIVELTFTTRQLNTWNAIRHAVSRLAPEAKALASAGSDELGRNEYRLHVTRGATDPRSWRHALVALASLADEDKEQTYAS